MKQNKLQVFVIAAFLLGTLCACGTNAPAIEEDAQTAYFEENQQKDNQDIEEDHSISQKDEMDEQTPQTTEDFKEARADVLIHEKDSKQETNLDTEESVEKSDEKEMDEKKQELDENENQMTEDVLFYEYASDGSFLTDGMADWQVELCKAALRYIEVTQDAHPQYAWIEKGEGNQVAIHLYDVVQEDESSDGHTATYAWYYIDQDTWEGEDLFGNPIDLNQQ